MGKSIYVQDGKIINYRNNGAEPILEGKVVVLTDRIGVSTFAVQPGLLGSLELSGVYEMDAENTAAFTMGQTVYWDDENKRVTATKADTGAVLAGIVVEDKVQASTRTLVRL